MNILDPLLAGAAGPWIRARAEEQARTCDFEAMLIGGETCAGAVIDSPLLPGRDFTGVGCDLADWDGISLEFDDYVGEPPTEAERERIFALGFTVIRIDYKDPALNTSQFKFHGDWSCVKGEEPRTGRPKP